MCSLFVRLCLIAFLGGVVSYDDGDFDYDPESPLEFSMPESCKAEGREFCFENDDYPTEIVKELLKDMSNLEVASNDDIGEIGQTFSSRQGSGDNPECRADSTDKPIHYIVDEAGRDRVVVQLEGKFQQRYSVMWCEKMGRKNNTPHFLQTTLKNYKLYCQNKYMNYDFLVLSLKPDILGKWQMERARTKTGIPVCCACRYEKV